MITISRKIVLGRGPKTNRTIQPASDTTVPEPKGRIPRISRLMALAIKLERMLRAGEVPDVTELARITHVTQPRMSQILNLAMLAPEIQEALLFLPDVAKGKPLIHEKLLRPLSSIDDWDQQRKLWNEIATKAGLL
jgi:hypothetical protein